MANERPNLGDVPGRSRAEVGTEVVKLALSAIPVLGGPVAELFDFVIGPVVGRRREEWLAHVGEALEEINSQLGEFDLGNLQENEQFVDAVIATTILAVKTRHQEKLESFRHAIVNSVLPGAPEEFEQMTFLRFVDELTPTHLRMLTFLCDPVSWYERNSIQRPDITAGGLWAVIEPGLPELMGRQERSNQILADLMARGLIMGSSIGGMMSGSSLWASRISEFGRQFLDFIT